METKLLLGDCLEKLKELPDNSVDSIVTDPPYGLGKEPDALAMLRDWLETGHHEVKGKGFMGKEWDAFVPQPLVWRECLRVLKPGGHLLSFAGTRTQDLMALGLRLAGFEIRDMVAWVYGSGFPKSLDVSKALDKMAGAEREVVGKYSHPDGRERPNSTRSTGDVYGSHGGPLETPITAPATDAAKQWHGWGTALKPALEPITLARKPLEGTVAANVLKWHTGGINVDGCRVDAESRKICNYQSTGAQGCMTHTGVAGHSGREYSERIETSGRWPANLIHDGSDEVVGLFPDTKSGGGDKHSKSQDGNIFKGLSPVSGLHTYQGDSGSAARFFYAAKCSKKDREGSTHPTMKPTELMRYLCRLITPPGGVILDPYMGSGSTGKAAMQEGNFSFIGIERDPDYFRIAETRINAAQATVASKPQPQPDLFDHE